MGINLEDGNAPPDLLAAKIEAVKRAARRSGVELFVNARTDVYLKRLVPPERAVAETIARAGRYRDAGCDGLFVPGLGQRDAIESIAGDIALPLNVMVLPSLAPVAELRKWGVRRLSAGSAVAAAALGAARRAAKQLLEEGRYEGLYVEPVGYAEMNALFPGPGRQPRSDIAGRRREAAGGGRRRNQAEPSRRAVASSTPQKRLPARDREKRKASHSP